MKTKDLRRVFLRRRKDDPKTAKQLEILSTNVPATAPNRAAPSRLSENLIPSNRNCERRHLWKVRERNKDNQFARDARRHRWSFHRENQSARAAIRKTVACCKANGDSRH